MTTPDPTTRDPAARFGPIDRDETMDRDYIPIPGGWEIQTKGKGSTFRICGPDDDRLAIPPSPYLHATLAQMARDANATHAALLAEVAALRLEVATLEGHLAQAMQTVADMDREAEAAEQVAREARAAMHAVYIRIHRMDDEEVEAALRPAIEAIDTFLASQEREA